MGLHKRWLQLLLALLILASCNTDKKGEDVITLCWKLEFDCDGNHFEQTQYETNDWLLTNQPEYYHRLRYSVPNADLSTIFQVNYPEVSIDLNTPYLFLHLVGDGVSPFELDKTYPFTDKCIALFTTYDYVLKYFHFQTKVWDGEFRFKRAIKNDSSSAVIIHFNFSELVTEVDEGIPMSIGDQYIISNGSLTQEAVGDPSTILQIQSIIFQ